MAPRPAPSRRTGPPSLDVITRKSLVPRGKTPPNRLAAPRPEPLNRCGTGNAGRSGADAHGVNRTGVALALGALALVGGCAQEAPPSPSPRAVGVVASTTTTPRPSGLPPAPDDATTRAYITALDVIDPRITGGKTDKAVLKGRELCVDVPVMGNDQVRLTALVRERFSPPNDPEALDSRTAASVLSVVREHLCPDY